MHKYIKQILSTISFKVFTDFLKDKIIYICSLLISSGGYMLTQNIIGAIAWLHIFLGLSIGIYQIRSFITNLKKDVISHIFTIKDRLIIHDEAIVNCQYFKDKEKVAISLSYLIYTHLK